MQAGRQVAGGDGAEADNKPRLGRTGMEVLAQAGRGDSEQPVVEEPGQCELGCGRRMPVDELPERGDALAAAAGPAACRRPFSSSPVSTVWLMLVPGP